MTKKIVFALAGFTLLGACASPPMYSQAQLPSAIQVPAGHKVALETAAAGDLTYQCRAKAGTTDQFEWVFVGPKAGLKDRSGKEAGTYFGPPATWKSLDGTEVSGAQVAIAPASAGNIPLQLVKLNPAKGDGSLKGMAYVQRVNTQGGVAPADVCDASKLSQSKVVTYKADYIFYKAQ